MTHNSGKGGSGETKAVRPSQILVSQEFDEGDSAETSLPPARLVLGAGDEVEIRFFTAPELNTRQTIRPDGQITLELVGEMHAAGYTPEQLRDRVMVRYASQLRDPRVQVVAHPVYTRRVYVGGEVRQPGPVSLPGPLNVFEAILAAGGSLPETAELRNVLVLRPGSDGRLHGTAVDLQAAIRGGGETLPQLHPRDVVYVPRTRITRINQWIEQHINQMIPGVGAQVSRVYPIGDGSRAWGMQF